MRFMRSQHFLFRNGPTHSGIPTALVPGHGYPLRCGDGTSRAALALKRVLSEEGACFAEAASAVAKALLSAPLAKLADAAAKASGAHDATCSFAALLCSSIANCLFPCSAGVQSIAACKMHEHHVVLNYFTCPP